MIMLQRIRQPATLALLVLVGLVPACRAGDELEHRHLTYIVARAIGFSAEEAEIISASSWSMDQNQATVAFSATKDVPISLLTLYPSSEYLRPIQDTAGLEAAFRWTDYPVRGFAIHALATPAARDAMRAHYTKEIEREIAQGNIEKALVHSGLLVHFIVDSHVHPQDPLLGHLLQGHEPDYAVTTPSKFQEAAVDEYRSLRQLFTEMHPDEANLLEEHEAAFGTATQEGLNKFALKAVRSLVSAYEDAGFSPGGEPNDEKFEVDGGASTMHQRPVALSDRASTILQTNFAEQFKAAGEPGESGRVPDFKKITFNRDNRGQLVFARAAGKPNDNEHSVLLSGSMPDPSAEVMRTESGGLARAHQELVRDANDYMADAHVARLLHEARSTDVRPGFESNPPQPFQITDHGLRLTDSAQKKLAAAGENIGGVKLEVVFNMLSAADDMPLTRKPDQSRRLSNPILVSLRNVVKNSGRSDEARSLAGITRIYGYLLDAEHQDIILVGGVDVGVPPIGLDALLVALRAVWQHGLAPSVSLDPDPQNIAGLQHPRVIGVSSDSRFAHVMLDADYAMKRVMIGHDALSVADYRTMVDLFRQQPGQHLSSRFWLYPVRFSDGDIRWSKTGDIALFSTRLQVLTEQMVLSNDGLTGVGSVEPIAEQAAREFAMHYDAIAEALANRGDTSLKELNGLLDVVTVCSLWRMARGLWLLDELAALEPKSSGQPRVYPGLQVTFPGPDGRVVGISGGVRMRRSVGSRLLDRYEDAQTRMLRAAAAQLESSQRISTIAQGLALLLVQSEPRSQDRTELAFNLGLQQLAQDNPAQAAAAFTEVLSADPEFFEALVLRAAAYIRQKQYAAAQRDLDAASGMAPNDAAVQAARLWAALESDSNIDMDAIPDDIRLNARDSYWRLGELRLVARDFPVAAISFSRALRCDPHRATFELLLRRAYAEELANDLSNAERDYHASHQLLLNKRLQLDSVGLNPWAALRDSLASTDLALGLCRVDVNRRRCEKIRSPESECKWPSMSADRFTVFQATYYWSAGRVECVLDRRKEMIADGTFNSAFSEFEVHTLRETVKALDLVLNDMSPDVRKSIGPEVQKAEELREALKLRIHQISESELEP